MWSELCAAAQADESEHRGRYRAGRNLGRLVVACISALSLLLAAVTTLDAQLAKLRPQLEARSARHQGVVGLYAVDLTSGEVLSIRGAEPFPSASVIKVPILVEVFHQIERGTLKWEDPLTMLAADQRPGSGILQFLSTPHQLTVGDAATLMIVLSDNTATNLLIDKVGIRNVNARMDSLGLRSTRLHAKVFLGSATTIDTAATRRWGLGVTTPEEMGTLFQKLYRGEVVSQAASRKMLDILKRNFDDEEIPRYLPPAVTVAHKTGRLEASRSDCGIVYVPNRDYVLCVFTRENQDRSWRLDTEARITIAELARLVHEQITAAK